MYIAKLAIRNFRCFRDVEVAFQPGVNVIIGENNAGKTALLRALRYVFERSGRERISLHDFHQGVDDFTKPPAVTITATLRSSPADTLDDKALVATWLTKLDSPWEAQLTYQFFLPDDDLPAFTTALGTSPARDRFFAVVKQFLPKFVSRTFGGKLESRVVAEPESLARFDCQTVDAIRDVESELFAGTNPLLRVMLRQVLDEGVDEQEMLQRREDFRELTNPARQHVKNRMSLDRLFQLVTETGAADGGRPNLRDALDEEDFLAALRLFIDRAPFSVPATHNGLGYNNLVYISLLLASLGFKASVRHRGQNAVLFPMLLIEEPEAHLHPALQYKLLKYIQARLSPQQTSRQVFLTTHSTHITAAAGLDPIICLKLSHEDGGVHVAYPGRVFGDSPAGVESRNYVERYLDATKSTMLFAKGVIFVEGIAEQLLVPCIARCVGVPIETYHIALIAVGGSTFKHFLPLFGACESNELRRFAIPRPVACLIDADPTRKARLDGAKRKVCWPYQLNHDPTAYEYFPQSAVVQNLLVLSSKSPQNIAICPGIKTLEYDLAVENPASSILVTTSCKHDTDLRLLTEDAMSLSTALQDLLSSDGDDTIASIGLIASAQEQRSARFATCYLLCVQNSKGEHAFALDRQLRENFSKADAERAPFTCPEYIAKALWWTCFPNAGAIGA